MKKICIIGDSHVASIKQAYDNFTRELNKIVKIDFYAARGTLMSNLSISENLLTTENNQLRKSLLFTSGVSDAIDVFKYDVYILVGLGLQCYNVNIDSFSEKVNQQILFDSVHDSLSFQIYEMIRSRNSGCEIYLNFKPFIARKDVNGPIQRSKDYQTSLIKYKDYILSLDERTKILSQPLSTVSSYFYTLPKYAIGSRRLSVGSQIDDDAHESGEATHMNSEYGTEWLQELLIELDIGETIC